MKVAVCLWLALAPMAAWGVMPDGLAPEGLAPEGPGRQYEAQMIECLDRSASPADQLLLSKWVFAVILRHPGLRSLTSVSEAERERLMRESAALIERLMSEDCRREMVDVIRYERTESVGRAFGYLGAKAVKEVFADSTVKKGMEQTTSYIDRERLIRSLMEEASRDGQ
jgi:hypothetical protein